MDIRLGHIELFVRDPAASLPFYCDILGFEVVADQLPGGVWLRAGDVELLLRRGGQEAAASGTADHYAGARQGMVLYVDGLDECLATLRERGLVTLGTDGSDRCITFTDPDGHWFQLVDPAEQ